MVDFVQMLDLVSRGGVLLCLIVAIWGGMRGWYLWKDSHERIIKQIDVTQAILQEDLTDMTKDRDFWRNQAIQALTTANKAIHVAKTTSETEAAS